MIKCPKCDAECKDVLVGWIDCEACGHSFFKEAPVKKIVKKAKPEKVESEE